MTSEEYVLPRRSQAGLSQSGGGRGSSTKLGLVLPLGIDSLPIAPVERRRFEVHEPSGILRGVSESVVRKVVGAARSVKSTDVGGQESEAEALVEMRVLSTEYAMGIRIDPVQCNCVDPPVPLQEAFNDRKAPVVPRRRVRIETSCEPTRTLRSDASMIAEGTELILSTDGGFFELSKRMVSDRNRISHLGSRRRA